MNLDLIQIKRINIGLGKTEVGAKAKWNPFKVNF